MTEAGFTPAQIIASATALPARYWGLDDRLGSLDVGKDASFLVTERNPLTDVAAVLSASNLRSNMGMSAVLNRGGVVHPNGALVCPEPAAASTALPSGAPRAPSAAPEHRSSPPSRSITPAPSTSPTSPQPTTPPSPATTPSPASSSPTAVPTHHSAAGSAAPTAGPSPGSTRPSGCTDPTADNYDAAAVVENGSCYCNAPNVGPPCNRTATADGGDLDEVIASAGDDNADSLTLVVVSVVFGIFVLSSAVFFFVRTQRQAPVLFVGAHELQVMHFESSGLAGPSTSGRPEGFGVAMTLKPAGAAILADDFRM